MDYRNIKRAFVFNKALHRHRGIGARMNGSDIFILLAVSYGYCNAQQVYEYMIHMHRRHNWKQVDSKLKALRDLELIERVNNKYSLSIAGRNALNDLEKLVRECRTDK